jgi:hypothetical protein
MLLVWSLLGVSPLLLTSASGPRVGKPTIESDGRSRPNSRRKGLPTNLPVSGRLRGRAEVAMTVVPRRRHRRFRRDFLHTRCGEQLFVSQIKALIARFDFCLQERFCLRGALPVGDAT